MVEWKWIEGYEGLYEISNEGNVRSYVKGIGRWFKPHSLAPRTYRASTPRHPKQYLQIRLKGDTTRIYKTIHRLVADAFVPNSLRLPVVHHVNGNKYDNRAANLQWVTYRENNIHALRTGLRRPLPVRRGERARSAKLTESDVREIRRLHRDLGIGSRKLTRQFPINRSSVVKVLRGDSWKHVA